MQGSEAPITRILPKTPLQRRLFANASKKTKKQAKGQQEVSNGDSEALAARPDQEPADVVMEIAHEDKENMGDTEMPMDDGIPQEA